MAWKLQGSASSLEDLTSMIKEKLYWSVVNTEKVDDKTWRVGNTKGYFDHFRIIKKGKRYRLEIEIKGD